MTVAGLLLASCDKGTATLIDEGQMAKTKIYRVDISAPTPVIEQVTLAEIQTGTPSISTGSTTGSRAAHPKATGDVTWDGWLTSVFSAIENNGGVHGT